ncbi:tetratricopeptide repeat protein [Mangrovimonas cancribranchiae]|uniref:Tetratricopeptide repeat protein n=1 Tax=Mangrovimonas cancribranchiae TaxID=3080055 RepID=A0AAU6P3U7_9FLAO
MTTIKHFIFLLGFLTSLTLSAQNKQVGKAVDAELITLKTALNKATVLQDSQKIAMAYLKLAEFYNRLHIDSEATKHYQHYLDIESEKDTGFVYVKNALGAINLDLKKFKDAKHYLQQSLLVSQELNYSKGQAKTHALLGSVYEKTKAYKKALKHQNISLSIFKSLNDSTGLAITNENLGSVYEDLEKYNVAYKYFKKAFSYAENGRSDIKINIINNLGDINRKSGHYNKALSYTEQALLLAQETQNNSQIESALKDLARIYAGLGDFEQAYQYLSHQSIVNEQEIERHNAELVSAMQVLYEVKEKEAELKLLNKQNQINTVRQYIILVCAVALLLALSVGFLYWKKKRKHEQHILEYKQQLLQADLDKKTVEEAALKREIDIKVSSLANYSLHIAHKNKMLSDVSRTLSNLKDRNVVLIKSKLIEITKDINSDLSNNNEWTELMSYFGQIHPDFFETLKKVALNKLSSSEMRLCMLLRLNLSSKEIAEILRITSDSVRIARYRLRKKLPINSKDDLQAYLLNL